MFIEQLDALVQAEPFEPFTLHMADGRSHYVPHPEWVSHSPTGRTVIRYHTDESFSIIDLMLVNECHVGARAKSKKSRKNNGHP